jgi:hypothetical protein
MGKTIKNILGSDRYVQAINEDINTNILLNSNKKDLIESDIYYILNVDELSEEERVNSDKYRLYGKLEYFSPLNNIKQTPTKIVDLFDNVLNDRNYTEPHTLLNNFEIYVVYPFKYEKISGDYYQVYYKKLTTINETQILDCSISSNIYTEQLFNFTVIKDIDLSDLIIEGDNFNLPITSLYLYFQHKSSDGLNLSTFSVVNNEVVIGKSSTIDTEIIKGEVIKIDKENFLFDIVSQQYYYKNFNLSVNWLDVNKTFCEFYAYLFTTIPTNFLDMRVSKISGSVDNGTFYTFYIDSIFNKTFGTILVNNSALINISNSFNNSNSDYTVSIFKVTGYNPIFINPNDDNTPTYLQYRFEIRLTPKSSTNKNVIFKYNPFIELPLKVFSTSLEFGSTGDTENIPFYAIDDNNDGVFYWRDLLDVGYIEPDTENGVDYPFINGFHYPFNDVKFIITPDMEDSTTAYVYNNFIQPPINIIEFNLDNQNLSPDFGQCN